MRGLGGVAERLNATVLKTVWPVAPVTWVRIPPPPLPAPSPGPEDARPRATRESGLSVSDSATPSVPEQASGPGRLGLLLAMAMFVLVVDTSLMNVSLPSVVDDLDTTVSGVQSAIALEALVSAAFILIGSKIGDLFGRKRAYVIGLLGYAVGAIAMTLAQSLL